MFHFAEPDEAGLGVITLTPGLTMSSQVLMPRGLPLRTRKTTSESVRMPSVGVWFQDASTMPASTILETSGSRERCTSSAGSPPTTARDWSPEAPYDVVNSTSLPASVFWKSAMTDSLTVFRTEKPTTLTLSSEEDDPLEAAQPDRTAEMVVAATASAANLIRLVMGESLFVLG